MRGPSLAREGPVSLEDSSTMTDNLKVTWILCSWKPPPHRGRPGPGAESTDVTRVPFSSCGETCCPSCLCTFQAGTRRKGSRTVSC